LGSVLPAQAQGGVGIEIDPASVEVSIGQTFTVDILVTVPGGEAVDTATASINFDPTKLTMLSITPGTALSDVWESTFDNIAGTIDFDAMAGVAAPDVTEDFVLATLEFSADAETEGTPLQFVYVYPERQGNRQTVAILDAQAVLDAGSVFNGNVVINAVPQCTLTTNVSPAEGGSVNGGGTYDCGSTVTVEAIPADDCWYFTGWSGDLSGSTNPTTILLDGDKTVTASFAKYDYTLTTNASPAEGGTVSGGGTYECGTTVTVTATPADECWYFVGWSGDLSGSTNPTTILLDGDKTVIANFAKYEYTLTTNASPAEGGTVSGGGTYECGTTVTVTAIPADDCWYFVGWSGDLSGSTNPTTILLDGDRTVTASFAKYDYTLTTNASPAEGGTVSGGGTYECGTTVTVTATPADECWYFVGWSGDLSGSTNPTTILLDGDKTVTANFAKYEYTLTTNASPVEGGTVSGGGTYECGTTVTVTATPSDACWYFVGWSGDLSGSVNPASIVMDGDKTVTANFARYEYTLTTVADPPEGGVITGGGTYECGTAVDVEAIPNEGYFFVEWSGDLSSNENPTTIDVNGDCTVTGHFVYGTTLEGGIDLQGRPGLPDDTWVTPLTLVFYEVGTATVVGAPQDVDTSSVGDFNLPSLEPGTCDIGIKCRRSLSRLAEGVVISGTEVVVDFGTLLEGDADNDDYIGPFDYSLLRMYYGDTSVDALESSDFNRDGFVDGFDYSLLRMNYGEEGEMPGWPLP
ncbi:MAG: InlB B-repeat-containing protein, partial [Chloroflexota bacterium]|nr:InlB B-repeat-containing protein [Chloroflexota bacterium]